LGVPTAPDAAVDEHVEVDEFGGRVRTAQSGHHFGQNLPHGMAWRRRPSRRLYVA
jgi:hypothetical protein